MAVGHDGSLDNAQKCKNVPPGAICWIMSNSVRLAVATGSPCVRSILERLRRTQRTSFRRIRFRNGIAACKGRLGRRGRVLWSIADRYPVSRRQVDALGCPEADMSALPRADAILRALHQGGADRDQGRGVRHARVPRRRKLCSAIAVRLSSHRGKVFHRRWQAAERPLACGRRHCHRLLYGMGCAEQRRSDQCGRTGRLCDHGHG